MVSSEPKYPIGTLVVWNGKDTHEGYEHKPFVVASHWYSGAGDRHAAYPKERMSGKGYYEDDLMLAEGPW